MFIEKYRPQSFKEMVGQTSIVKQLEEYINKNKSIPNLLFVGDPGIGKTSLAYIIARGLFGENYTNSFLELNASSDRGIEVVRKRIQEFARTKSFHQFKIVFLDEASEITKDAQHALRRIMEVNYKNCRFILSCNYQEKITSALQSRCKTFVFERIKSKDLLKLAKRVISKEDIKIKKQQLKVMVLDSRGDARRLLNGLEIFAGGEVEGYEEALDDLLSLDVEEFRTLVYSVDNERILNCLVDQAFTFKSRKMVTILADCDARFRFGCIKSLQLINAFLKIKAVM